MKPDNRWVCNEGHTDLPKMAPDEKIDLESKVPELETNLKPWTHHKKKTLNDIGVTFSHIDLANAPHCGSPTPGEIPD